MQIASRPLLALLFVFFQSGFLIADDKINTTFFGNLAVEGYDTVAYFTEHKALKGNPDYETEWKGAKWRFVSQNNLRLFKNSPEKYAPQYGGYCAYAVSQNKTASIEPQLFTIHRNKLYLSYSPEVNKKFQANRDLYIKKADTNWLKMKNK